MPTIQILLGEFLIADWRCYWLEVLVKELLGTGILIALALIFNPRFGLMRVFELTMRPTRDNDGSDQE